MDNYLPLLLSFPPNPPPPGGLSEKEYSRQIKPVIDTLNKCSVNALTAELRGGGDLFSILDPSVNSLPYLWCILAHIERYQTSKSKNAATSLQPGTQLWLRLQDFLEKFDPRQVTHAGAEWRKAVEIVARAARSARKPLCAVRIIRTAILRLDPTGQTFTSTHLLFVKLCLESYTFRPALPILDRDILEFPTNSTQTATNIPMSIAYSSATYISSSSGLTDKLKYHDHMEYHLLGAMIYIGLHKWERAMDFLAYVIGTPSTNGAASGIMIEAYKKWVLIGLISTGSRVQLPKAVSGGVLKACRVICRHYDDFAVAFVSGNAERLRTEFLACEEHFQSDLNHGLAWQALDSFHKFNISHLEDTYLTLSIKDIAERDFVAAESGSQGNGNGNSKLESTEKYILGLIESNDLNATISHPPQSGVPTLHFNPATTTEASTLSQLESQLARTQRLTDQIKTLDRKLGLSKEFLGWEHKAERSGGVPSINFADLEEESLGVGEDLMGD